MNMQDAIRTSSRIKALYLMHVRGLRLRAIYCTPVITLLSTIVYTRTWVLVPAA